MAYYAAENRIVIQDRDRKAEALRQRQLDEQRTLTRLQGRTDYAVEPNVVGTRNQSVQRVPVDEYQRLPVGEQIVRNPALLRGAIAPAPVVAAIPQPRAVSTPPTKKYPLKNTQSILSAGGMPTGMPVKKWPTSFKNAFHTPTTDETIMRGLDNLDNMSKKLLGRSGR